MLVALVLLVGGSIGSDEQEQDGGGSPSGAAVDTRATTTEMPSASADALGKLQAKVARVIDGDTIQLSDGQTVRYIGVDTPETVAPNQPVACYGHEASEKNKELVEGKTVYLEKDVSETDRFQRLLRYVYLETGEMVNELLVRDGYAQVATFPPDVKYEQRFLEAQRTAREANRGLWGACLTMPTPKPTKTPPGNCSAAYPNVCIPPPPPDLDCGDILYRRFMVLTPDPHNFDRDGDGIGCES